MALILAIFIVLVSCNPCKRLEKAINRNPQCLDTINNQTVIDSFIIDGFIHDTSVFIPSIIDSFIIDKLQYITVIKIVHDSIFVKTKIKQRLFTKKRQVPQLAIKEKENQLSKIIGILFFIIIILILLNLALKKLF